MKKFISQAYMKRVLYQRVNAIDEVMTPKYVAICCVAHKSSNNQPM